MRNLAAYNIYHIYNRGVNRQAIFFRKKNWDFFLDKFRGYATSDLVDVLAYCLMPNHYHLMVYLKTDNEFGSKVMQPFGTSFTKAINEQEDRVGALFQGRYKPKLVDNGRYLHQLSRYIHLNPVEAGLVRRPEDWQYSSYREYIGKRQSSWLRPQLILDQFDSPRAYQAFVADGFDYLHSKPQLAPYLFD